MKTPKATPRLVPLLRDLHPDEDYPVQLSSPDGADNVILISSLFMVEPKVLDDLILPQIMTEQECELLTRAIGREVTAKVADALGDAIRNILVRIAISNKVAPWKEYARRLRETRRAVHSLLRSTHSREAPVTAQTYLSVDHAIQTFLETRGMGVGLLENLLAQCDEQLEIVEFHASKRGVKADISIQLFMKAVVSAAQESGAELIVGMHKEKQNQDDELVAFSPDTPLLTFAKTMLNCARARAPAAFSQSHGLSANDKKAALLRFDELMRKDGRALQHQLKVAIDTLGAH
jgi:hypothetical protein